MNLTKLILLFSNTFILAGCTNNTNLEYEVYDLEDQISELEQEISDLQYDLEESKYCVDELDYYVADALENMENGFIQDAYSSLREISGRCRYR